MEQRNPTIRGQVIEWMIDNPGEFTVTRLAGDLALTRRQVLNALHGLKRSGLSDLLHHHGSGLWEYRPAAVRVFAAPAWKYDNALKPTRTVPVGFTGSYRVLAMFGPSEGIIEMLIEGEPVGVFARLELLEGPVIVLEKAAQG